MISKHIANEQPYQWLDWIESGIKKFEGRLNKGDWKDLKVGDKLSLFDDNQKTVIVEVTELRYFKDFVEAFNNLGKSLVPIDNIQKEKVFEIYNKYFSTSDVQKYGVVAVGIKPIYLFL